MVITTAGDITDEGAGFAYVEGKNYQQQCLDGKAEVIVKNPPAIAVDFQQGITASYRCFTWMVI